MATVPRRESARAWAVVASQASPERLRGSQLQCLELGDTDSFTANLYCPVPRVAPDSSQPPFGSLLALLGVWPENRDFWEGKQCLLS